MRQINCSKSGNLFNENQTLKKQPLKRGFIINKRFVYSFLILDKFIYIKDKLLLDLSKCIDDF